MTSNGKDFLFSKNIDTDRGLIDLNSLTIIGPPCSELGFSVNDFTFGWVFKCNSSSISGFFIQILY